MILHSRIIEYLKMYKIYAECIKFIENTMKNINEVKILRGIFQGDWLTQLLFVKAMMPINLKLDKCTGGYKHHEF